MDDNKNCSFDDLHCLGYTGRAYIISGTGRDRKYGYRHGITCKLGDIEEREWIKLMEELIIRSGEQELQKYLVEWVSKEAWKPTKEQAKRKALILHSSRIFDNELWVSFLPFNRRYRPEILLRVKTCLVSCDCCNMPGAVTQAMLEKGTNNIGGEKAISCPVCGRWSTYQMIENI